MIYRAEDKPPMQCIRFGAKTIRPEEGSTRPQLLPYHQKKRHHFAVCIFDTVLARKWGFTSWQTRRWCIIHFGKPLPELLPRTETVDSQILQERPPQATLEPTRISLSPPSPSSGGRPHADIKHSEAENGPTQEVNDITRTSVTTNAATVPDKLTNKRLKLTVLKKCLKSLRSITLISSYWFHDVRENNLLGKFFSECTKLMFTIPERVKNRVFEGVQQNTKTMLTPMRTSIRRSSKGCATEASKNRQKGPTNTGSAT